MKCCIKPNGFCSIHELIEVLIAAIEEKDPYTRGHSDRVADFTSFICEKMQLPFEERNQIHMAAHLHDLGKIYVPDYILNKAGKLNTEEWLEIKKHPETGSRILEKVSGFDHIAQIVKCHHERWDGFGYPNGLSGNIIPLGARIIALSDAVDAMLSVRPYRQALSMETCVEELEKGSGSQFDPSLVPYAIAALYSTESGDFSRAYPPTYTDILLSI